MAYIFQMDPKKQCPTCKGTGNKSGALPGSFFIRKCPTCGGSGSK